MTANIFKPHESLSSLVKCYWTLESTAKQTPIRNTIVADGCMKMIFHYGDIYKHYEESGECNLLPRCFLIGQLTKPYIVEPTGDTGTFFVCFHPNGFLPFTNLSLKALENIAIPLDKVFGDDSKRLAKWILDASSTEQRISLIETFLFDNLNDVAIVDHILRSTVTAILTASGQLSVKDLSRKNNISSRQLSRKCALAIGLGPKQLSKIIRLQGALKALIANETTSLTNLASQNEYFDQAHFIKDFREFTGLTPKEFYGDHLKMSLIFDDLN